MIKPSRKRQRIQWSGAAFVLIAVFVLVAAINTGANLLYLVAGGLISFLVLSIVLSRSTLRRLRMSREAPSRVHRTEPFSVTVRLENRKLLLPSVSLRLEEAERQGTTTAYVLKIPPRRAALVHATYALFRRGLHQLSDVNLVTSFPFGLIESRSRFSDDVQILVYPRVYPVRSTMLEQLASVGGQRRHVKAEGDEFFSLRPYVRGDDPRRIAWRSSARQQTLVVREMEANASRTVTVFLDTRREEDEGFEERFEEAVDVAASLAVALLAKGYTVALVSPEHHIAGAEGSGQARIILEALAHIQPTNAASGGNFPSSMSASLRNSAQLLVTPDPSRWGLRSGGSGIRVVDPREIVRA